MQGIKKFVALVGTIAFLLGVVALITSMTAGNDPLGETLGIVSEALGGLNEGGPGEEVVEAPAQQQVVGTYTVTAVEGLRVRNAPNGAQVGSISYTQTVSVFEFTADRQWARVGLNQWVSTEWITQTGSGNVETNNGSGPAGGGLIVSFEQAAEQRDTQVVTHNVGGQTVLNVFGLLTTALLWSLVALAVTIMAATKRNEKFDGAMIVIALGICLIGPFWSSAMFPNLLVLILVTIGLGAWCFVGADDFTPLGTFALLLASLNAVFHADNVAYRIFGSYGQAALVLYIIAGLIYLVEMGIQNDWIGLFIGLVGVGITFAIHEQWVQLPISVSMEWTLLVVVLACNAVKGTRWALSKTNIGGATIQHQNWVCFGHGLCFSPDAVLLTMASLLVLL